MLHGVNLGHHKNLKFEPQEVLQTSLTEVRKMSSIAL